MFGKSIGEMAREMYTSPEFTGKITVNDSGDFCAKFVDSTGNRFGMNEESLKEAKKNTESSNEYYNQEIREAIEKINNIKDQMKP